MKTKVLKLIGSTTLLLSLSLLTFNINAQEPVPMGPGPAIAVSPPGGGPAQPVNPPAPNFPQTPPGNPVQTPPPNPVQTPPPPPGWGGPGYLMPPNSDGWMNQGNVNVMATGYDSQGVMKQIPLYVSYQFNGVNYDITVLNAWNPYTYQWDNNVDQPAYSTSYYFNGFTYNYYTVLSTGTYYFNL